MSLIERSSGVLRNLTCRRALRAALGALAWVGAAQNLAAAPVDNLYTATVAGVTDGAPSQQQLTQGLAQVLIKVSGRGDILSQPQSRTLLDNAQLLLLETGTRSGQRTLTFAPEQLAGLMESLGLPVLATDRPELLLWLAARQDGSVDYASGNNEAVQRLREAAERRGLPLRQPLLDLDDQLTLTPQALATFSEQEILQASARYQPAAVLVGLLDDAPRAESTSESLQPAPNWVLWQGRQRAEYHLASSVELARLVDQVADRLFQGASDAPGTPSAAPQVVGETLLPAMSNDLSTDAGNDTALHELTPLAAPQPGSQAMAPLPQSLGQYAPPGEALTVRGIAGTADYVALIQWLNAQPGVRAVHTAAAGDNELRLSVETDAGRSLAELGLFDSALTPLADGSYRWAAPAATSDSPWEAAPESGSVQQ